MDVTRRGLAWRGVVCRGVARRGAACREVAGSGLSMYTIAGLIEPCKSGGATLLISVEGVLTRIVDTSLAS